LRPNLIALLAALLWISSSAAAESKVTFTPQVGVNASFLTGDLNNVTYSSSAGYQIGLNIRFGGFFHLQQGLYWQRNEKELTNDVTSSTGLVSTDMIHVPILAGLTIVPLETLDLRVNTGASMNFLLNVGENTLGLTKDDFKTFVMGWVVGVGLDFLFLSADLSYELGLTTAVEVVQPDGVISAKNNVLRFSVGFRI
jgi:hypothetical protein